MIEDTHRDEADQADAGAAAPWSAPEPTGVGDVDAALVALAALDSLPTAEHVAVYDTVHKQLQGALADLDGRRSG